MNTLKYIFVLAVFAIISCNNAPERPEPVLDPNYAPPASATPNPNTPEPAQNTAGVWHYTCSNGCAGGGGSATACATCGSTLVHNTEYHNTAAPSNTTAATTTTTIPAGSTGTNVTPAAVPKTPEPAQNASGVWHYTCNNGCSGGGGSATACASCGSTLVHNTAYHN